MPKAAAALKPSLYQHRQTVNSTMIKGLKKHEVDRDIPEFPPTKCYFVMQKNKGRKKK